MVEALLADMRVRVVSFTGSTPVGRRLLRAAAENVVTPAMELGGNAPAIVFDDADLEAAVEGVMLAKLRNVGEACTAANRIYLHADIADAFTARLTERMALLKLGNGLDDGVDLGPLVNAETRDKVAAFVDDAVAKGARLVLGGKVPEGKGFFYPPTVLADVPDNADCLRDEIFGPVAAIQTFRDQDEVIARANATEYGLVAYVFTGDLARGLAGLRAAGVRDGRAQPRARVRPGGAVRRDEAVGARPRGRARGDARVSWRRSTSRPTGSVPSRSLRSPKDRYLYDMQWNCPRR